MAIKIIIFIFTHSHTDTRWMLAVGVDVCSACWLEPHRQPSAEPSLPFWAAAPYSILSSSASEWSLHVKSFLYSFFFFWPDSSVHLLVDDLTLQIHSCMVCWLTSSHQKAAVAIQIVHKSRHFARKRDSLQPSNSCILMGHTFIMSSRSEHHYH